MYQTIKYEVKENIAYVTINRPEALNALNKTVLEELFDVFNKIDADEAVRAVILTGEGNSDSAVAVLGMVVGAAFCHNFGLASSGAGSTLNGQIAVCIGFAALLVISLMNIAKEK